MTATTWDPFYKSSGMALSGGNLIGTTSALATVSATRSLTSLLSYFEVVATTLSGVISIGLVNRAYNMASGTILGTDANGVGFKSGGTVVINNSTVATIFTYTGGDRIGVAVDIQYQLIWFTKNGTTWNNDIIANQNPVGRVGGISLATMNQSVQYPAAGASATGNVVTAAFTTLTYTAPTGYASVDTSGGTLKNSAVPKGASYSTMGGQTNNGVSTSIAVRASWTGPGRAGAFAGGQFSPASAPKNVSGQVKELGAAAVGKTVRALDNFTGDLLGSAVTDASGNYSIPALGRPKVDLMFKDPTTYQALSLDEVVPV